jgi:hypothetical protein
METTRLYSEAKANMRRFGVLVSMVVHHLAVVCRDDLVCMSRNE